MSDGTGHEMTLAEWCARLPENHQVNRQLQEIVAAFEAARLIANRDYKPFEAAALEEEIPDTIEVKVNRKVPAEEKKGMNK